uniref:Uncharacterized protein n=1 Tax=viral metagenome TaxID=1070528 RepID=A0A6M3LVW1_9ZZZZ
MVTDTNICRCDYCGVEGVYGVDIVDTDWHDPVHDHDIIRIMCKDIEACLSGGKKSKVKGILFK